MSRVLSRDQTAGTSDGPVQFTHNDVTIRHQLRYQHGTEPIVRYGRKWVPDCPDLTTAAINLVFCLKETEPMAIPEHLPETRLIALATQRSGPTKEDVRKIRGYNTKLFADTIPIDCLPPDSVQRTCGQRSKWHDLESYRMVLGAQGVTEVKALSMMCGRMTGAWEGFYRIASIGEVAVPTPGTVGHERQHHAPPDFICLKPMQSVLAEYVCFADKNPNFPVIGDESEVRNLPKLCLETEAGFELDGRKYERLAADSDPRRENSQERETREPVDIVLLGETIEDHEQAWGGFRFAGRIRKDGSIILKREAKEDGGDAFSGTWIFEGRLRFGTVFVGTASPSAGTPDNSPAVVRSIFSMQKRVKDFTSW